MSYVEGDKQHDFTAKQPELKQCAAGTWVGEKSVEMEERIMFSTTVTVW
jgi:hypothetical protein